MEYSTMTHEQKRQYMQEALTRTKNALMVYMDEFGKYKICGMTEDGCDYEILTLLEVAIGQGNVAIGFLMQDMYTLNFEN